MMKVKQQVYVVYPAALFDGWEVVREPDDTPVFFDTREQAAHYAHERAALDGGGLIQLENWFGDIEGVLQVRPPTGVRAMENSLETCN